jgi:uncharacterized protein (TIGR03000 family)
MNKITLSHVAPTLALFVLLLTNGFGRAQSTAPNPGTAGMNSRTIDPYWSSSPTIFPSGAPGGQGTGMGYSTRSPSPLSGGSFGPSLMGLAGSTYSPRPGQYSFSRSFPSSMIGYYSPAALAEAASLFSRNPQQKSDNTAHIILEVPSGAEVWFDGKTTRQTGPIRHFRSPPLQPGKNYVYELRVRWQKDGKPVEETRRVNIHANDRVSLELTHAPSVAKSSLPEVTR